MTDKPADAQQNEATKKIVEYLEQHQVTDVLNEAVNALCSESPEDAYGFLITYFQKRARPPVVSRLVGREILDSRGNPTVEVDVYARVYGKDKFIARQAAPSGASTGSNEAHELRDTDKKDRYMGKGVTQAVKNVTTVLSKAVAGKDIFDQKSLDAALCEADGTRLKTNLGGNAITAASFALADAAALLKEDQLFLHFAQAFGNSSSKFRLPRPMVNILNGGKHAGGDLQFQEFMIVPKAGIPFRDMLRSVTEVYHHLGKILVAKYGKSSKNLGDEGGYAPNLKDPEEALTLLEEAITASGKVVGEDVFLAMDCAASEFYRKDENKYEVEPGKFLTPDEMVDFYVDMVKKHPAVISIEDPLDEKDYDTWKKMTARFSTEFKSNIMIVGDDLYTTNTDLISQGVANKWANSLLLKVNQIGTISEAFDAARMVFDDNGQVIVSHRSGETGYHLIADLAVGIGAGFIKTGATARGERTSKYNRLLQIEEYLEAHYMAQL